MIVYKAVIQEDDGWENVIREQLFSTKENAEKYIELAKQKLNPHHRYYIFEEKLDDFDDPLITERKDYA